MSDLIRNYRSEFVSGRDICIVFIILGTDKDASKSNGLELDLLDLNLSYECVHKRHCVMNCEIRETQFVSLLAHPIYQNAPT